MTLRRDILKVVNLATNLVGAHVLPLHEYDNMRTALYYRPRWDPPEIPAEARIYLDLANPRLAELRHRYDGHPAAAHTQWKEANLLADLQLTAFRGENHYLYQVRYIASPERYFVTAYHIRGSDQLGLFGRLNEDGMFGAYTLPFENGYIISRDLLESINEINFIYRMLGCGPSDAVQWLDVGAGYGRIAHRLTEAFPAAHATCTDAVPISTFLSEFYLRFRGVDKNAAEVVPLDEVEKRLTARKFSVVTNIHSFSECRKSVVEWWLGAIQNIDVSRMMVIPNPADLMVIPNAPETFLSTESDGTRRDLFPLFEQFGWRLTHKEPIYASSRVAQSHALYPNCCFYWFERH